MAIDPTKVLIIVNTNTAAGLTSPSMVGYPTLSAASLTNADYYATARGMKTNGNFLRMGFDFGSAWNSALTPTEISPIQGIGNITSLLPTKVSTAAGDSTAYNALPMMKALSNFIIDNGVQAILVECNVPPCVWVATPLTEYMPIECFLAFAPIFGIKGVLTEVIGTGGSSLTALVNYVYPPGLPGATKKPLSPSQVVGNLLIGTFPKSNSLQFYRSAQQAIILPNGRIGYPGAQTSDIQRMVTDAIWAEGQDNRTKLHLIGGHPYTTVPSDSWLPFSNFPYDNVSSNYLFSSIGFSNIEYFDNDWTRPPEYVGTMVSVAAWEAGTLPTSTFGLLYGSGSQTPGAYQPAGPTYNYLNGTSTNGTAGGIYTSHTALRGGWSFAWQSSAYMQGICTLRKGGAASVCNVYEPRSDGLPGQLEFAANIVSGMSMMESVYLSAAMRAPRTTVYGDPLYRPYKLTAASPNEFSLG